MLVAGELFVCVMEDRISYLFVGSLAAPSRLFIKKTKPFIRGGQVEGRAAKPYRLRQQQHNEFNKYRLLLYRNVCTVIGPLSFRY